MFPGPSGSPGSINFTDVNMTSITVQWTELPCSDRNSEIAGYTVEYSSTTPPHTSSANVSGSNNTSLVVGGLLPRTSYTFRVRAQGADAARNGSQLTGTPEGKLQYCSLINVLLSYYTAGLGFFLEGRFLSNNSIILLGDIGEGSSGLYCLTKNAECCLTEAESMHSHWEFPNGSDVAEDTIAGVYFTRGFSSIHLNRKSSAVGPTGVYKCLLPDATSMPELKTLYIGVYEDETAGELLK